MSSRNRLPVVLCLGNELVADDAVGYEIYRRIEQKNWRVEYCGTGGIDLLPKLTGESEVIVVDAVQFGAQPGTIHVLPWQDLPSAGRAISAHGLGLRETVEIGLTLDPDQMPQHVTLLGIEGICFNRTREAMTVAVANAIDQAVVKLEQLMAGDA